jgi:hypothetical protein
MLNTPCPFCNYPEMPVPPSNAVGYAACPKCGRSSRAKLTRQGDETVVEYVATSEPAKFVLLAVRVTPEQKDWAHSTGNASRAVRDALDMAMPQTFG